MLYVVLTNYNIQSSTVSHPLATWCVYNAAAAAAAAAVLMWFAVMAVLLLSKVIVM